MGVLRKGGLGGDGNVGREEGSVGVEVWECGKGG